MAKLSEVGIMVARGSSPAETAISEAISESVVAATKAMAPQLTPTAVLSSRSSRRLLLTLFGCGKGRSDETQGCGGLDRVAVDPEQQPLRARLGRLVDVLGEPPLEQDCARCAIMAALCRYGTSQGVDLHEGFQVRRLELGRCAPRAAEDAQEDP